jgi:hypothetical protein
MKKKKKKETRKADNLKFHEFQKHIEKSHFPPLSICELF